MDIREFLAVQLQDDEDYARQAAEEFGPHWTEQWTGTVNLNPSGQRSASQDDHWATLIEHTDERVTRHIIRHDPARVLAEVAAKRRILEGHALCGTGLGLCDHAHRRPASVESGRCGTLRDLAAPYADHPDFNPSWSRA